MPIRCTKYTTSNESGSRTWTITAADAYASKIIAAICYNRDVKDVSVADDGGSVTITTISSETSISALVFSINYNDNK